MSLSASPREGRRGLGKGGLGRKDWGGVPWFPGGAVSVVVMGLGEEGWHGASCIVGVARARSRSPGLKRAPALPTCPMRAQNVPACQHAQIMRSVCIRIATTHAMSLMSFLAKANNMSIVSFHDATGKINHS